MSGDLPDDPIDNEFTEEVLGLCISCKGCARDRPSEADMAKLETGVMHVRHQKHGSSPRDKLFVNFDTLAPLGSTFVPISNLAQPIPGVRTIVEKTLGIARKQALPRFQRETVRDWLKSRGDAHVVESNAEWKTIFFVDSCTNYSHTEVGKAAVRVLEAAGVHVRLAEHTDSGRPVLSKGFIEKSRDAVESSVAELVLYVRDDWDVVLAESSDTIIFQSDALDLCDGPAIESLAVNAYGVCEYLDSFRLGENADWEPTIELVTYHGHRHQKAVKKDHHTVGVLRHAGYEADPLDSGCCGMARSFGYESEHYPLSKSIGEVLFEQIEVSEATAVTVPGTSCQTQLSDDRIETVITENSLFGTELDREEPSIPVELFDYCPPN